MLSWVIIICLDFAYFLSAFTDEEQQGLAKHNEFRQVHEAAAMTLDRQMCDEAKQYAQTLAVMGSLVHSPGRDRGGQGENLAVGCSTDAPQTIEQAVTNWWGYISLSSCAENSIMCNIQLWPLRISSRGYPTQWCHLLTIYPQTSLSLNSPWIFAKFLLFTRGCSFYFWPYSP